MTTVLSTFMTENGLIGEIAHYSRVSEPDALFSTRVLLHLPLDKTAPGHLCLTMTPFTRRRFFRLRWLPEWGYSDFFS